jgi:CheY-like chemotaxis protein
MPTGHTILIVEDCPDISTMEADLVRMCGHCPLVAYDGVEALETLESARVDLVLLDLNLPRLDGQAVLDHMAADPDLSKIPVVILSANPERARPTPQIIGRMQKPFDLTEFIEAVERRHQLASLALTG